MFWPTTKFLADLFVSSLDFSCYRVGSRSAFTLGKCSSSTKVWVASGAESTECPRPSWGHPTAARHNSKSPRFEWALGVVWLELPNSLPGVRVSHPSPECFGIQQEIQWKPYADFWSSLCVSFSSLDLCLTNSNHL